MLLATKSMNPIVAGNGCKPSMAQTPTNDGVSSTIRMRIDAIPSLQIRQRHVRREATCDRQPVLETK
jgi:hypothetical protein